MILHTRFSSQYAAKSENRTGQPASPAASSSWDIRVWIQNKTRNGNEWTSGLPYFCVPLIHLDIADACWCYVWSWIWLGSSQLWGERGKTTENRMNQTNQMNEEKQRKDKLSKLSCFVLFDSPGKLHTFVFYDLIPASLVPFSNISQFLRNSRNAMFLPENPKKHLQCALSRYSLSLCNTFCEASAVAKGHCCCCWSSWFHRQCSGALAPVEGAASGFFHFGPGETGCASLRGLHGGISMFDRFDMAKITWIISQLAHSLEKPLKWTWSLKTSNMMNRNGDGSKPLLTQVWYSMIIFWRIAIH